MRERFSPTTSIVGALLALLLVGCGARETVQQPYPYLAPPTAALPTVYPPPAVPQPQADAPAIAATPAILYAGNVYGVVVDAELRIVHVEPGGGAEQGGLRIGDTLRSIAGVELRPGDPSSLRKAREAAAATQPLPPEPGVPVPFTVERDGAPLTLQVAPAFGVPQVTPGQLPPTVTPVLPPFDYF
jgi:hypothetical protein